MLVKWNSKFRLVGSSDPRWLVDNILLDSLLFLRVFPDRFANVLDLGTGAGVPGISLKIVLSEVPFTLVEARRRPASFLAAVVRELSLTGIEVIGRRAEDVEPALAGRFDVVVMRCAGGLDRMLRLGVRLLRSGGVAIAAGPPAPRLITIGEWRQVSGVKAGQTRHFVLARKD
jgi:16S rRNA (guanine527-N7)-methyltransferase